MSGVGAGNPVATLGDYELRHLGEHLENSGNGAALRRLLSLERAIEVAPPDPDVRPFTRILRWLRSRRQLPPTARIRRRNAWYEAKEAIGDAAGYGHDVELSRRMGSARCAAAAAAGTRIPIEDDARAALLLASVSSLGGVLPPALLHELLARGVWRADHALAHARRAPGAAGAAALVALVPLLDEDLRRTVIAEFLALSRERLALSRASHADLLVAVASELDVEELGRIRREVLDESEDGGHHASRVLRALAHRLAELGDVPAAVAMARDEIPAESVAAESMSDLAPLMDEPAVRSCLAVAAGWDPQNANWAACGLWPRLAELGNRREALAAARTIEAPPQRNLVLRGIARSMDREGRRAAYDLLSDDTVEDGALTLLALADAAHRDGDRAWADAAINRAVTSVRNTRFHDASEVAALMPALATAHPEAALQLALRQRRRARAVALGAIVGQLRPDLATRAREAAAHLVKNVDRLGDDESAGLAATVPALVLHEVLALADRSAVPRDLVASIAPHLDAEQLRELRDAVARVGDERMVDHARVALDAELTVHGDAAALERLGRLEPTGRRAELLAVVAPRLPDGLIAHAAALVRDLRPYEREVPSTAIAPRLTEEQLRALLDTASTDDEDWVLARAAEATAPYLAPEGVRHALALAMSRTDAVWRIMAVVALVPRLEEPDLALAEETSQPGADLDYPRHALAAAIASRRAVLAGVAEPEVQVGGDLRVEEGPAATKSEWATAIEALGARDPYYGRRVETLAATIDGNRPPPGDFAWGDLAFGAPSVRPPTAYRINEALQTIADAAPGFDPATWLPGLAGRLAPGGSAATYAVWSAALPALVGGSRDQLLGDLAVLAPLIRALGGHEAIDAVRTAVEDVARWWP